MSYEPHRGILQRIARRAMIDRGLLPESSPKALKELAELQSPAAVDGAPIRNLTDLLWCSIDNDDSRDLDQLTVAKAMADGKNKIFVAVADVDSLVNEGSAIDADARHNTTSVYTAAQIFPMLPERLSTDLTSLNFSEDRMSVVIEMVMNPDGSLDASDIYTALVRNRAKLAYNSVAAWLDGEGEMPEGIAEVGGLAENIRLQDKVAQSMKAFRHLHGALSLETIEAKAVFEGDLLCNLETESKNRAKEIIEDFMIAANGVVARYLAAKGFPCIRRVVRAPRKWERIVQLAGEHGFRLPGSPDSKALEQFLTRARSADPVRFPDLSLSVIKLMGPGEYVAELAGQSATGHFGLAVRDYAHSTAPNRRYPDLLTQRLLKAAIGGMRVPYGDDELEDLATHCTEQEDAAKKVERQVSKSAAALLLESRVGEKFDAIVTGAADKGTWARLLDMPVEGKLVRGFDGVDIGDRIRVRLMAVDVERGFIDFANARA